MSEIEPIGATPASSASSSCWVTTASPTETAPPARAVVASGAELALDSAAGAPPTDVPERMQVGTYNVAGGNETFSKNFEARTSDALARQLVSGAVDVVALQEVAVGNENAKGRDYNVEILRDVFAQTHGLKDGEVKAYYLDEGGKRHAYDPSESNDRALQSRELLFEGGGHSMRVTKETFDSEGHPVDDAHHRPGDDLNLGHGKKDVHPITAYRGVLDSGVEYNVVFGDTAPGKMGYGNAVVLGPGFSFRDAEGNVRPGSFEVCELGHDPELWKDRLDERERRTALGVKFETPRGQTATAFSAHLSTESISAKRAENLEKQGHSKEEIAQWKAALPARLAEVQRNEMLALEQFAHAFGGETNVVIGADMNLSRPFKTLPGFHYKEDRPVRNALDHVFTSRDVVVNRQGWVPEPSNDFSDHQMSVVDIRL